MSANRPIRFLFRGRVAEVDGLPVRTTVLEWLRAQPCATGSKEGCAEGDCGACTVVVGELDAAGELVLRPVNACIRLLPSLDGKALFTVEDLQGIAGGAPHPVQVAMVEHHGSQCGFCTPGFVMSLFAVYEAGQGGVALRPTRGELAEALAGNLCRCTGYRPILDAASAMFDAPAVQLARQPVAAALRALAAAPALHYAAPDPATGRVATYAAPRSVAELAQCVLASPGARLLAGGTDLALEVTLHLRDPGSLIAVNEVAELRRVVRDATGLTIGAAATLEDGWATLAAEWPELRSMWKRFAGPPVRHAGTLVGNLANGSPIGDSAPVLLALDAVLVLQRGEVQRELPLADFQLGYRRNALAAGEFIAALRVPARRPGAQLRAWKLARRHDCDISAVALGACIELDAVGNVARVRLGFGGMADTVRRARAAEAALLGAPWDAATLARAQAALAQDFAPITDLRGSREYRAQSAAALLARLWLATRREDSLPDAALGVWDYTLPEDAP